MAIPGSDGLELPTIYKAYFSGLCKGIDTQNMALYGTNVPPFEDPGITIDYISIKLVESQQYSCLNCDHSPGNAGIKAHKYCCRMGHHSYVRWLINHEINPSNYSCINLPKSIEFSHFSKATATHLFSEESRQASSARCSYGPRPR